MQFIPVVERQAQQTTTEGLSLISPELQEVAGSDRLVSQRRRIWPFFKYPV
ncbi:hypothetical protein AB6F55_20715 [Providencia hangzhouensis]